ncbi:flavodoxin family protein, partial [Fusobacterium nucleatum]
MKTLIVYSTISGNTKSVCERIYRVLKSEKKIVNVKDIKNVKVEDYDNIIIGFWCDKGTMDKDSIEF